MKTNLYAIEIEIIRPDWATYQSDVEPTLYREVNHLLLEDVANSYIEDWQLTDVRKEGSSFLELYGVSKDDEEVEIIISWRRFKLLENEDNYEA